MGERRFILVATVASDEIDSSEFKRFLESLHHQHVEIALHLVVRGLRDGTQPPRIPVAWPASLSLHAAPVLTGLARARNIALDAFIAGDLGEDDVVAFPDDDCWYPERLLQRVSSEMGTWDVVTGSYGANPPLVNHERFRARGGELDWCRAYEQTASVTQFYRGTVVRDVGAFDERFGLGARFSSAEDVDYLVRAISRGWRCYYKPSLVVGHACTKGTQAHRYEGGVALLAKHARKTGIARRLLARRLLSGTRDLVKGELSLATYSRSVAAVLSLIRSA